MCSELCCSLNSTDCFTSGCVCVNSKERRKISDRSFGCAGWFSEVLEMKMFPIPHFECADGPRTQLIRIRYFASSYQVVVRLASLIVIIQ